MPEPKEGPLVELPIENSDDEMTLEFFLLWVQMIKIESVVPYYSGGLSSRKFGNCKMKAVAIFEKAQVLEQYWVQIAKLYLQGKALSY